MGRTPCKCCHHEAEVMKKGHWEKEEDEKLKEYMSTRKHNGGRISWRGLPKSAGLNRCGKSCRLRWLNYLRDGINRGNFTANEVELIIKLHSQHGNKWSTIAGYLENRTDNEIKNFWNTHIKKKLLRDGIDPDTHQRLPPDVLNEPLPLLTHPGLNSLVPTAHAAAEGARLRDLAGVPIMWQMQLLQVQLLQAIASHAVSSSSSNINTTAVANTPPAAVANAMLGYSTMYPNFQDDMNIPRSRANYPVYSRDVFAAGHEMAKQMTSTTTAPIFSSCAAPTTQYCGTARADATSSSGTVFQNYLQDTTYILSPSDFPGFVCDTNSNVARQEIVMPQLNKSTTPVVFNSYAAESTAQYSSAAALVSATSPQQVSAGATDGPAQEGMRQQDLLPLLDESWSEIFARSYHV